MRFTKARTSTAGLVAALAARADADAFFTIGMGMPVAIERVDPLLAAGQVSNHVHAVLGGNAFQASMDFATTQKSICSTNPVRDDLSNYWMPALYFQDPKDGTFTRVPENPFHKIYYKFGTHANVPDPEMSEFPSGFRMITGNAMLRSDDGSAGNGSHPGNSMNWQCHDGGNTPQGIGFPTGFTSCNANYLGGLAASMRFPSCWNGQDFNPKAPQAHMAFPTNADGMAGCPAPFNVKRFPEIFAEYWLDTKPFDGKYSANDKPWVLAQGDPTGFGFHMDFLNGWKPGVLAQAMKTCTIGDGAGLEGPGCFGAAGIRPKTETDTCRVPKPAVNENVGLPDPSSQDSSKTTNGNVGKSLPGCNPIQPGPQMATIQTNCANVQTSLLYGTDSVAPDAVGSGVASAPAQSPAPIAASAAPMASSANSSTPTTAVSAVGKQVTPVPPIATAPMPLDSAPSPSTAGASTPASPSGLTPSTVKGSSGDWKAVGCYSDLINPHRSLDDKYEYDPHTMSDHGVTATNCVQMCDTLGKKIAGLENGGQCFCGDSLKDSSEKAGECTSKCDGDSSEICGGPARLSIYTKSGSLSVKKRHAKHRRAGHHFGTSI